MRPCLFTSTSQSADQKRSKMSLTVWSLPKAPSAGRPCDPSEWDPSPSSASCQCRERRGWGGGVTSPLTLSLMSFSVVWFSCARTCSAPAFLAAVSSVPLFSRWLVSERWRLRWFQPPRPSRRAYAWTKAGYQHFQSTHWTVCHVKTYNSVCACVITLTLVLLWPRAALSTVRRSAEEQKERVLSRADDLNEPWGDKWGKCYTGLWLSHLLWEPVRWTARLWERFDGPTYRHP